MSGGFALRALTVELMERYGKVVTIEGPIARWPGDFVPVRRHPEHPEWMVLRHKDRHMVLPAWLNPVETPTLTADVLTRLVDQYHRLNPTDIRYKVSTSWLGFHILPEQEHSVEGRLVPANLPLDTVVTVPWAKRLASGHFSALCSALENQLGVKIYAGLVALDQLFAANGHIPPKAAGSVLSEEELAPYTFEWSVDAKTVREALLDLVSRSATTLHWSFLCDAPLAGRIECVLGFVPVPVRLVHPDGAVEYSGIKYDRVATKPEFLPRPPAPQP